ncbi:MAG TPA: L-dopachrome tautomerase-related protein [Puia sp.]|nr:L-dopachrome tautomerase-related protein [Puia sp.]
MKRLCVAAIALLTMIACKKSKELGASGNGTLPSTALELVFSDNTYQLTGVAISKEGRLFTNYPLWSSTYKNAVVEIQSGTNNTTPYPNQTMNSWASGDDGLTNWVSVQAVYVDGNNNLWVVDPASPLQKGVYQNSQKLVEINLATNSVTRTYPLTGVTDDQSYINDVRVDVSSNIAYLTNSSEGGIIIVDLNSGNARQVLQGNYSVIADQTYILSIDGQQVNKNGSPFYGNSDGLALSPDNSYLYYKPLTDHFLYRIPTASLLDSTLSPNVLAARVENLGTYTTTDGMIFDKAGNLYLGDLENHSIIKIDPSLKMTTLLHDDRLIWPDSYSISSDGYLYLSTSQINKEPDFNGGQSKRTTPYAIYRIKLP